MNSAQDSVLVSVVMIFRDAAAFFEEAIDSVLEQTHTCFELLLCDDGSSDQSTAIARARAAADPARVRYLEHPGHAHRGMSSTRNLGLASARGDVVAFLDADDVWEPEHVAHELALLRANPAAAMVCGQAVEWYSWGDPDARDVRSPLPWPPGVLVPPPLMLGAVLRRGAFSTPMCSLIVRRGALEEVGGSEDGFRGMYEDQALLAKLYLSQTCVISGTTSARYRRHASSSTALAMADGTYDPVGPNVSEEKFLRWVRTQLGMESSPDLDEVRVLLAGRLERYADARCASSSRTVRDAVPRVARRVLGGPARRIRARGPVRMGSLRRLSPLSRHFGYDRGLPIDRYYIEQFLAQNAHVVSGRVLEVGDSQYTRRFGGHRVTQCDVLNLEAGHPETTYVADLSDADHLPSDAFDCLVITQTLHLIYDMSAAVRTLRRILRPGGVLLATVPGISPVSSDLWAGSWYWSLTPLSALRLFGDAFGPENVEVEAFGNVLTSVAFLEGMAADELHRHELDDGDPQFPMLITVRAYRPCIAEAGDEAATDGTGRKEPAE